MLNFWLLSLGRQEYALEKYHFFLKDVMFESVNDHVKVIPSHAFDFFLAKD